MSEISVQHMRQFQRRAETCLRRINDLSCDMIEALGTEHQLTDYSDGATEHAEYLVEYISKWIENRKRA